ncbi:hypothetical protein D3C73_798100 [compost metagenome]
MEAPVLQVTLDIKSLEEAINSAVDAAIKKHAFASSLPPLLTRPQVMEIFGVKATKIAELFNRPDFPVLREFGHPRVPSHLMMQWIDENTDWVSKNASHKF